MRIFILLAFLGTWVQAAELAPTGTLRAVFLGDNPVQGRKDPVTGAYTGLVADLTKELARKLGIPFTLIPAPDTKSLIASMKEHKADVGFLAWEAKRAEEVDFAGGYLLMFNSFLVPANSPIHKSADADRKGVKVGGVRGQSQQIYLGANFKNATMRIFEETPSREEMQRLLTSGELDAFGINRQRSVDAQNASGGKLRALDDSFLQVEQAFVVEKGDPAKLAYLNKFVDELRESGFVQQSITRAKLSGVGVSPGKTIQRPK